MNYYYYYFLIVDTKRWSRCAEDSRKVWRCHEHPDGGAQYRDSCLWEVRMTDRSHNSVHSKYSNSCSNGSNSRREANMLFPSVFFFCLCPKEIINILFYFYLKFELLLVIFEIGNCSITNTHVSECSNGLHKTVSFVKVLTLALVFVSLSICL